MNEGQVLRLAPRFIQFSLCYESTFVYQGILKLFFYWCHESILADSDIL